MGFENNSGRVSIRNIETGRKATARRNRFNGKVHGYGFVCDNISLFPCKNV